MYFIFRNSHISNNYLHSSLKLIYKSNSYVLDFSKHIFCFFFSNIYIITRYYLCHQNHHLIWLFSTILTLETTKHMSVSVILALEFSFFFSWSILLQIAYKHWRNINVLICINKPFISYGKWFICGGPLPNLIWGVDSQNHTTWSLKDQNVLFSFFIYNYAWKLNQFSFLMIKLFFSLDQTLDNQII